jgi:hypothetical protein
MIHEDKSLFKMIIEQVSKNTSFERSIVEKDYYLTLLLSKM